MKIVFLLFNRITALDAVGPYEVLSRLPGANVVFAAPARGLVRTDNGAFGLWADLAIDEVDACDLLVIPGGYGTRILEQDPKVLDWIRALDRGTQVTASVCTGAFLLGAAGCSADGAPTPTGRCAIGSPSMARRRSPIAWCATGNTPLPRACRRASISRCRWPRSSPATRSRRRSSSVSSTTRRPRSTPATPGAPPPRDARSFSRACVPPTRPRAKRRRGRCPPLPFEAQRLCATA